MRILAFTIRKLCGQDIPFALLQVLPKSIVAMPIAKRKEKETVKRLRVCFQWADDNFLYVVPLDALSDELLKIRYRVKGMNEEFSATVERLWQHAQLNLLDASVDEEGIYTPAFIVLEPDYLLDISSLAECFKDYGSHPANYNLSKLVPISNARPLLLGNIANLFLDEWIHANGEVDYKACMQKAFKNYPIEIAACEDLKDKEKEQQFFDDCKMHFEHIREVVTETFHASGYDLNKEDAVLEPSYICEALGIQGRLDYMQRDMSSFIEMKSGKADEFAIRGKVEPKENNKVQMLLYMAVLEYSMGQNHKKMRPYLLYTRYPLLYPARPVWNLVKKAINVRNLIVANEYGVQLHNNQAYTSGILAEIQPKTMNEKSLHGKYWEQYLKPSIENYGKHYAEMSTLEQSYYITLFNFITKEQYTAKSGDTEHDGRVGTAALWLSTLQEKCEAGEILYDLKITDNRASDKHKASLTLSIPTYGDDFLPNFRAGDVVVLYERNCDEDKVTNKLVFKGSIDYITTNELKIRIRATQQNISVFAPNSLYAVEHDSMDTTFRTMYQGLHSFAVANKDRRDLLLSQRLPDFDPSFEQRIKEATNDFERIALKAEAAKDYFLLVGPPGTGKTSHALKRMVETFYAQPQTQLLLLAYTNRAVDEI
ncbi:MAG: AAA family ATPase, partial [Bacteroides sp.]